MHVFLKSCYTRIQLAIQYKANEAFIKEPSQILGLDLGDQWIGIACSDKSGSFAFPLTTVTRADLVTALTHILHEKPDVKKVVVGLPITMQGNKSQQTLQVEVMTEALKQQFPHLEWIFWDERLSSKRAMGKSTLKDKTEKLRQHAKAAAHILDLYLTFQTVHRSTH